MSNINLLKTIDSNIGDSLLNDSGYLKEVGTAKRVDQKKLEEEINKKKIYLSAFFLDIHKKGDSSYLKSIIDGDNPGDILRDQKLKSYFTSAQVELIDQLQTDKKKLIDTKKIINKNVPL